jgi:uncharacterized protein involved in exopolysaccharide biosynthesis
MKPNEITNYCETGQQWLADLLGRREELSIQLATLDVEIGIVSEALRSRERVRTKGVSRTTSFNNGC